MKHGENVELVVDRYAAEGKAVGRVEGYVVFVRGAVPGDTVQVRIIRAKRSFADAEVVRVVEPSLLRVEPRCPHFGPCGGCAWQNLTYDAQLTFKRQQVVDALERLGGFRGITVQPAIGADDAYFYRNKMEFSFGTRWLTRDELVETGDRPLSPADRFALGLHIPQRFDRVLDIRECFLQSEESSRIVNAVRTFCLERELTVYSTATHTGYLRNLVIREGKRTGERMVNLVTHEDRPALMDEFTAHLRQQCAGITTVVNNITTRKSGVAVGETERVYYGPGHITERIGPRTYTISANSFFQTNTLQAERLYDTVRRMAVIGPMDTVFDLYCGTGTIALHIADDARAVVGVEAVEQAVDDARRNAEENGVKNCTFVRGDLKERLVDDPLWLEQHAGPDVMIIDPPRAGMHEKVVRKILQMAPPRIVYGSCNPATQARDLRILCEGGAYVIDSVQPVDMFPHTTHVENVVRVTRTR